MEELNENEAMYEGGPTWKKFWKAFDKIGEQDYPASFNDEVYDGSRSPTVLRNEMIVEICKRLNLDPTQTIAGVSIAKLWQSTVRDWESEKRHVELERAKHGGIDNSDYFQRVWRPTLERIFHAVVNEQKVTQLREAGRNAWRGSYDTLLDAYEDAKTLGIETFIANIERYAGYSSNEVLKVMELLQKLDVRNFGQEMTELFSKQPLVLKRIVHEFVTRIVTSLNPAFTARDIIMTVGRLLNMDGLDQKYKDELRTQFSRFLMSDKIPLAVVSSIELDHNFLQIVKQIAPDYVTPRARVATSAEKENTRDAQVASPELPKRSSQKMEPVHAKPEVSPPKEQREEQPLAELPAVPAISQKEMISLVIADPKRLEEFVGKIQTDSVKYEILEHVHHELTAKLDDRDYLRQISDNVMLIEALRSHSPFKEGIEYNRKIKKRLNHIEENFCLLQLDQIKDSDVKGELMAVFSNFMRANKEITSFPIQEIVELVGSINRMEKPMTPVSFRELMSEAPGSVNHVFAAVDPKVFAVEKAQKKESIWEKTKAMRAQKKPQASEAKEKEEPRKGFSFRRGGGGSKQ